MQKKPPNPDKTNTVAGALASSGESVLATAALVGLGVWGGAKLDEWLHCAPWLTIGLALLGVGLGLARMVMKAMDTEKK
jgi:F0F1-type ATP synthase assembly protein I